MRSAGEDGVGHGEGEAVGVVGHTGGTGEELVDAQFVAVGDRAEVSDGALGLAAPVRADAHGTNEEGEVLAPRHPVRAGAAVGVGRSRGTVAEERGIELQAH